MGTGSKKFGSGIVQIDLEYFPHADSWMEWVLVWPVVFNHLFWAGIILICSSYYRRIHVKSKKFLRISIVFIHRQEYFQVFLIAWPWIWGKFSSSYETRHASRIPTFYLVLDRMSYSLHYILFMALVIYTQAFQCVLGGQELRSTNLLPLWGFIVQDK